MKASTGERHQAAASPRGEGGAAARIGRNDHQSRPSFRAASGSSGYGAPASTQARTVATSAFERAPFGGISPSAIFSTSRLSPGRPGTIAAPFSPPARADARRLRSSPPFFFSGPWQDTHCWLRMARASFEALVASARDDPGGV